MALYFGGAPSGVGPNKFDDGIDEVKQAVAGVQTSVDGVQDSIDELSTGLQDSMEQLVTDVGDQVDEMQETINNAPVGGPLPFEIHAGNFSASSTEEGIKLTYKATAFNSQSSMNHTTYGAIVPYGIMIRYSEEGYPQSPKEGLLAVDDTDIINKTANMESNATYGKQKTHTVVGLTNGTKYYFSAFPYSYAGLYNVNPGYSDSMTDTNTNSQRKTCTWTGTKATLIVTITQDYNYNSLGEITVTATPTAGGDAKTGSRTGAGDVAISLDAGEYTVSVTAQQHFITPANQTVNVIAGQPNTMNMVYQINKSLDDYTWNELGQMIRTGAAKNIFPVGSKKTMSGKKASFTYSNSSDNGDAGEYSTSDVSTQAILMDYDKDGANTASFITKDKMFYAPMHVNSSWNVHDSYSSYGQYSYYPSIRERVQAAKADMLPAEIRNNLKTVNKQTCDGTISKDGRATMNTFVSTTSDDVCIPSLSELGFPNIPRSKESPISYYYFSSDERRAELNGTTTRTSVGYYMSSSSYTGTSNYEITTNGTYGIETISGFSRYIDSSITFVIG